MLSIEQRKLNYAYGVRHWHKNDSVSVYARNLTPKQRRRIRKKDRAQIGDAPNSRLRRREVKMAKQAKARRERLTGTKRLLKSKPVEYRECPTCGVAGEWEFNRCLTANKTPARKPHKGRYPDAN